MNIKERLIEYFDSISGSRNTSKAPRVMKRYMEEYCNKKDQATAFKIKIRQDVPMQTNGVDCGVFVCLYAERIARNAPMNFAQRNIETCRVKMTHDLFLGKILKECPGQFEKLVQVSEEEQRRKKEAKIKKKKPAKTDKEKERTTRSSESGKDRINWPPANSKEWHSLDIDITNLLKTLYSSANKKAESHPQIIYAMCKERFGVKEKKKKTEGSSTGPSRRQRKCKELRENIEKLKTAYQQAPEEEKEAISELHKEKLKNLRHAKRAESLRQNRKKFSRNCNEFLSQPYEFSRKVISPKPKGKLESNKEEVEKHLQKAHNDPEREKELEPTVDLWKYDEPNVDFKNDPPTFAEFMKRLRKTRSKSAPGPNGVPYVIYKRCPGLAKQLWSYLKKMWKENLISDSWRKAEGILIPKVDGATTVDQFRTISLLNVEGKIYFALRADRLLQFVQANGYIDSSIQKGGLPDISGCLEHTAVLSQLIREAKAGKKNLVITWLDIANAYGSVPHNLIQIALQRAHVPEYFRDLVESYYNDTKIRFSTAQFTTEWQRVEKGIITGCTLSVVLFALTMTMLVMSAKDESKGPTMASGQRQESCRLFMDDVATTTETTVQTKHLLQKLSEKLSWGRLSAKPEKCRSMVIEKGKISKQTVKLEDKPITSITERPVKYLGKTYNLDLNERQQTEEIIRQAKKDLKKIDRCRLPGRYKAWMLQHMFLPRLMWPLSIYNIPETKIGKIQNLMTSYLKKWLGLPKSLSVDCLYSKSAKLQLPFTSLTEEVKVAKARNLTSLNSSEDPCVRNARIVVDGGRKANTPAAVEDAESRLRMRDIVGTANKGREGLGLNRRQNFNSASKKERRTMITSTIREAEEEERRTRVVQLGRQGASTKWEVPERQLSHKDILDMSAASLKFLVKSVHDLLPTPANKNMWFGTNEACLLCGGYATLNHILTGCKVALRQGRYKWRHDQVLKEVAKCVEDKRKASRPNGPLQKKIQFVKAGEKLSVTERDQLPGYFDSAKDWRIQVDLGRQVKIPIEVMKTNLRPDIVMSSSATKSLGIVELTVPSEERIEVSGELKRSKYQEIAEEGKAKGWKVKIWAVEVGCKGFPAASMSSLLKDLGYSGTQRKNWLKKIGMAAETASSTLWKCSQYKTWGGQST